MNTVANARTSTAANTSGTFTVSSLADIGGRLLLVGLFLFSGIGKITAYSATAAYMASTGVPGALLPLVILTEVGGSIAILLGYRTRVIAFLMAGFTLLTGLMFHTNFADQMQVLMFMKNISIAGGFLLLVASGAGALSLDAKAGR